MSKYDASEEKLYRINQDALDCILDTIAECVGWKENKNGLIIKQIESKILEKFEISG